MKLRKLPSLGNLLWDCLHVVHCWLYVIVIISLIKMVIWFIPLPVRQTLDHSLSCIYSENCIRFIIKKHIPFKTCISWERIGNSITNMNNYTLNLKLKCQCKRKMYAIWFYTVLRYRNDPVTDFANFSCFSNHFLNTPCDEFFKLSKSREGPKKWEKSEDRISFWLVLGVRGGIHYPGGKFWASEISDWSELWRYTSLIRSVTISRNIRH